MVNGFGGSVAYSFTRADALLDGQGFINASNWRQIYSLNGRNNPMVGRSVFDVGSRVTGTLSYRKEYGGFMATTVSLFYNGQSGQPFSYVYRGGDALFNEDNQGFERTLIYVPANAGEIVFGTRAQDIDGNLVSDAANRPIATLLSSEEQAAMWSELDAYVDGEDYLSERRGQYAEQYRSRAPFESVFDLKLLQDFYLTSANGRRHTLQLSLDVFNVSNLLGNWFGQNWGQRYFVGSDDNANNFQLIAFEGFQEGTNQPVYSFRTPEEPWDVNPGAIQGSRWAAQFGVRYSF